MVHCEGSKICLTQCTKDWEFWFRQLFDRRKIKSIWWHLKTIVWTLVLWKMLNNMVGNKMTRNCSKMIIWNSCIFFNQTVYRVSIVLREYRKSQLGIQNIGRAYEIYEGSNRAKHWVWLVLHIQNCQTALWHFQRCTTLAHCKKDLLSSYHFWYEWK